MGIQKTKIMKSIPTFNGHNFGSFWARVSSKKALFKSWLALSTGMKSEGSAGRAVHVQGDWKLCTRTARRKKILKPGSRWIRVLRQKLYPVVENLGNRRNFCKQLGSALSDSTTSKKAFCRSWLALSNAMKSVGNTRRAVHVQGDWKLCTCTARRKKSK